jgi:hypothetical protein
LFYQPVKQVSEKLSRERHLFTIQKLPRLPRNFNIIVWVLQSEEVAGSSLISIRNDVGGFPDKSDARKHQRVFVSQLLEGLIDDSLRLPAKLQSESGGGKVDKGS